jgi:uncharacterized protein
MTRPTDHARPLAGGRPYHTERRVLAGVPCLIERPDAGRNAPEPPILALTLVLHGAYDSKEGKLGVYAGLCAGGVAVVIPDAALHGERAVPGLTPQAMGERNYVWTAAARTSSHLPDLVTALHERFGPLPVWTVGSSMGGYSAQHLALHDTRVSRVACLISGGVWDDPQADSPEALAYLEGRPVDHARLAPPTHLLLQNGAEDPLFPAGMVDRTAFAYREAYAAAGCPERFEARTYPGVAHYSSVQMRDDAVAFLMAGLH